MCVCVPRVHEGQKRVSGPLELELLYDSSQQPRGAGVFGGVARPPSRHRPQNVLSVCEALGSKGQCWSKAVRTCHVLGLDVLTLHREQ